MEIVTVELTPFMMNCYVLKSGEEAIVIDPGEMSDRLTEAIGSHKVTAIVNTHCHIDHSGGNAGLKEATNAPLLCHEEDLFLLQTLAQQGMMFGVPCTPSPDPDAFLKEGDTVTFGETTLRVLHVPGHSPGHIALITEEEAFVGDLLFSGSIGRTDLPGGSFPQLIDSIKTKLFPLGDAVKVYCGHGPVTTIGQEKQHNPFLNGQA